jgi:hypothetical protein
MNGLQESVITVCVSVAVVVGIWVTKDPNCLWGLIAVPGTLLARWIL